MKMVRAYNEDGSHSCFTWRKQKDGRYTLVNEHYDSEGYYVPSEWRELADVTMEYIEGEFDAMKAIGLRVDIF